MIDKSFILKFKEATEDKWRKQGINPGLYGFQFQKGTRWDAGLADHQINQYENELGFSFPPNVRLFLSYLNGTDLPTLNVYGGRGEPHRTSVGVYSFPKDLQSVKERLSDIAADRVGIERALDEEEFEIGSSPLLPFYAHRYVVCGSDFPANPVLSIYGTDAIVLANNFRDYLEMEFTESWTAA